MPGHFLLLPVGSAGDTNPFLGIGATLRDRGHDVELLINEHFLPQATRLGLKARPSGSAAEYESTMQDPKLWDPREGTKVVLGHPSILKVMRLHRDAVREFWRTHPQGVVLGGTLAFGGRVAQELDGGRYVTLHLQPYSLLSTIQPPRTPIGNLPSWTPRWGVKLFYWVGDRLLVRPAMQASLLAFRRELGLPNLRGTIIDYMNSPTSVLLTVPPWYAYAADWPAQVWQTDFPICDGAETTLPADLEAWLSEGPPPIVCTLGSAMVQGRRYYTAFAEAAAKIGVRLLVLTRAAEQLPDPLPPGVRRFNYAPLAPLLPRTAGTIHHGGIGTTARALASGKPQLVIPFGFDQYDNGARIQRLGLGDMLPAAKFDEAKLPGLLRQLTDNGAWLANAQTVAARCTDYGLTEIATGLERIAAAP
jgi:UDP:flavonoid glycosyltransferase YjiC (YdhE family)